MQTRRWKKGDIYAPHDLSPMEMRKWKQRVQPDRDIFDTLNINPLDEYKVSTPGLSQCSLGGWEQADMEILELCHAGRVLDNDGTD